MHKSTLGLEETDPRMEGGGGGLELKISTIFSRVPRGLKFPSNVSRKSSTALNYLPHPFICLSIHLLFHPSIYQIILINRNNSTHLLRTFLIISFFFHFKQVCGEIERLHRRTSTCIAHRGKEEFIDGKVVLRGRRGGRRKGRRWRR